MPTTRSSRASKPKGARVRMRAFRERMRALGYKAVQVWLPDVTDPRFMAEARRQSRRASAAGDAGIGSDFDGWK